MSDHGLIYYVLDATRHSQRVKIGFTRNLKNRLDQLTQQTVTRCRPIVLALEAGTMADEQRAHVEWCRFRLDGEWFRYEGLLQEHIADLPNPVGYLLDHAELWQYAGGALGCPMVPQAVRTIERLPEDEIDPATLPDPVQF